MIGLREYTIPYLEQYGIETYFPDVVQTLTEEELIKIVPNFDGWIIGDDPATGDVFKAGASGRLKAAVKWGIGVDNVDFDACKRLNIPITNTPNMFGKEVADIAWGYVIALARETFFIDQEIRKKNWPKNCGISLEDKTAGLIGYGDIGKNTAKRLKVSGMEVIVYDPVVSEITKPEIYLKRWPDSIEQCDFLIFTCSLNNKNRHMFNRSIIDQCKPGIRIVNVARGALINETDLCEGLATGKIHSAALDVFETEPLPDNSKLRTHPLCILGSHNSSNTFEAVMRTNKRAIDCLLNFLGILEL